MLNKYLGTLYDNTLVTDILKRVYFSEEFTKSNLVENYFIEDGDTPESIAYILYKKSEYAWYILTLNILTNKFEEWPLTQNILSEYIEKKYPTSSIVINPNVLIENNINLSNIKYIKNSSISFEIKQYDKNLSKLITNFKINDNLKNLFESSIELYDKNNNLLLILNSNYRIIYDDKFSIHNFQVNNNIVSGFSSSYNGGPLYIESYSLGESNQYVITNYQYEINKNDAKRNIILIRPEYIEQVSRQFRKIMTGINKTQNVFEIPKNTLSSLLE
jgi:hypothetical protein